MFDNLAYTGEYGYGTIRELGRQVSGVVNEVRTTGRPAFVTHRGTPVAVLLPLDAEQLEDYILANAPEYVASMREADEAIEQDEPGVPLADAIAEFEVEHGPLRDAG
ncbi:MAG: type II toxin-antitoxin system prevent-host-death family antitoxin [Solirubrobacteraceae bacterium]